MLTWLILLVTTTAIVLLAIRAAVSSIQRESDTRYRRQEAWLAIYSVIQPRVPLPAPAPYQASPELLRWVVQLVSEQKPGLILELGSGISTVLAAYCLERAGQGRIISVDHEAVYCRATHDLLLQHGLQQRVRVIQAPLVPVESAGQRSGWYDPRVIRAALEDLSPVDLLVVDGPPGKDQPLARFPALPMLLEHLSPRAIILVDDARRPDEQEMVRRWVGQVPGLKREDYQTEKGTIVLRRQGQTGGSALHEG
jgi:predicted O-methyltransferase YrrM